MATKSGLPSRSGKTADACSGQWLPLELTQECVGHVSPHEVLKGDGPCFPRRTGPLARVEAAEVFLEFTKEPVDYSMRFRGDGPRSPGRFGPPTRFEASEVPLEFTQEFVGHPSLHAVLKGVWPCFSGRTGPFARVEAAEVFLEFTKGPVGHSMRFKKAMGRALQDELDLLRVLKHLKYFWNLPKSQLPMRFSKEMGHASQDDLDFRVC